MRLHLKSGWKWRKQQVREGGIMIEEAAYLFRFDYGDNDELYRLEGKKIWIVDYPVEPD